MAVGLGKTKATVYKRRTKWASPSIFLPFCLISLFPYSSLYLILQQLQAYWANYWPNHPENQVYKRSRIAPYSAVKRESFPAEYGGKYGDPQPGNMQKVEDLRTHSSKEYVSTYLHSRDQGILQKKKKQKGGKSQKGWRTSVLPNTEGETNLWTYRVGGVRRGEAIMEYSAWEKVYFQ